MIYHEGGEEFRALPRLFLPMTHSKALRRSLPALFLGLSLFAIYLRTLAPGLTWANSGSDGGDLIAAAATGGVPHPTGYPLYLLLARLFQLLPFGSLAYRTNLMSALLATLAAVLVYEVVWRLDRSASPSWRWLAGLASGYAFGLAPLVWSQAVITEVYALQALLVALIIYLYTGEWTLSASGQKRLDRLRGLVLGLAMGNHLTTILLLPAAFVVGTIRSPFDAGSAAEQGWLGNARLERGAFYRQLMFFGIGLCVYLILPLRALGDPPVNWGNAITPQRFWWLVSGQLYQSYYLQLSMPEVWGRVQSASVSLLQQFGWAGLLLSLFGLVSLGKPQQRNLLILWSAAVYAVFAVIYGSADWYVHLIPTLLCLAIWLGSGIPDLAGQSRPHAASLGAGISLLLLLTFAMRSVWVIRQVDASGDLEAEAFGREILSAAPQDAIVFAEGDRALFALWYFHFALGERPDLAVLAEDLLHFDWYQENLRQTYPSLNVPGPFPWPGTIADANPARPVCYVWYEARTEMDCSTPGER